MSVIDMSLSDNKIAKTLRFAREEQKSARAREIRQGIIMDDPKQEETLLGKFTHFSVGPRTLYLICGESDCKRYWILTEVDNNNKPRRLAYTLKDSDLVFINRKTKGINHIIQYAKDNYKTHHHDPIQKANIMALIPEEKAKEKQNNRLGAFFRHPNQDLIFFICGESKCGEHWICVKVKDSRPSGVYHCWQGSEIEEIDYCYKEGKNQLICFGKHYCQQSKQVQFKDAIIMPLYPEDKPKDLLGKFVRNQASGITYFICGESKEGNSWILIGLNTKYKPICLHASPKTTEFKIILANADTIPLIKYAIENHDQPEFCTEINEANIMPLPSRDEPENLLGKFIKSKNNRVTHFICGETHTKESWILIQLGNILYLGYLSKTIVANEFNIVEETYNIQHLVRWANKHHKSNHCNAISEGTIMDMPKQESYDPFKHFKYPKETPNKENKTMSGRIQETAHKVKDVTVTSVRKAATLEVVGRTGLELAKQQVSAAVPNIPEEIKNSPLFDIVVATIVTTCAAAFTPHNQNANTLSHAMTTVAYQNGIQKLNIPELVTGLVSKVGVDAIQELSSERDQD